MPICPVCMKLEDALEATTLDYDELLIQQNKAGANAAGQDVAEKLAQLRHKREELTRQLTEHKATHMAASA